MESDLPTTVLDNGEPSKALVRHNFGNDDIVIMTGKKGSSRGDYECGSNEIEEVQEYLKALKAEERPHKYIGLSNQGATCYMNSLL